MLYVAVNCQLRRPELAEGSTVHVLAIFTKYFNFHQFLNNLVFFTQSLFIASRVIELVVQPAYSTLKQERNKEVFMTGCPCCSNQMLRHVRQSQVYWFCRQCWQEMPVYDLSVDNLNTCDSLPSRNLITSLGIKKRLSSFAIV
jgi:hypothetical protein